MKVLGDECSKPGLRDRDLAVGYATVLTVIVPVFNEVSTVLVLLNRVFDVPIKKQIIVVDDGSDDGSEDVLDSWARAHCALLLRHEVNLGKGRAIRTALAHAKGAFTIIQDADLEYDPTCYISLLKPLISGNADVVFGSRYLGGNAKTGGKLFRMGVRMLNLSVAILYGTKLTDEATCYKMLPTKLLQSMELQCEGFEFCPEVTAKACRMGLRIVEVPVSYSPRLVRQGKKIRWHDGITAFNTLRRWRKWTISQRPEPASELLRSGNRLSDRIMTEAQSCDPSALGRISIIVPTLNEGKNLTCLFDRIRGSLGGCNYEVIVVDDGSIDNTVAICKLAGVASPVKLFIRKEARGGLSGAVLFGCARAAGDVLVVMDGDLQHPPEYLHALIDPILEDRADFVLGSRYVEHSRISERWGLRRRATSQIARALASPLVAGIRDPMSGFFAIRRDLLHRARDLDPIGYKIALELLCKCPPHRRIEVPIGFGTRMKGYSKLNLNQQLCYLHHLFRLYKFRLQCHPRQIHGAETAGDEDQPHAGSVQKWAVETAG